MSSDVVHIKLEYGEATNGKRSILFSQMSSLKAAKAISRFKSLRISELAVKNKLATKMKEARTTIKNLQTVFPEPKIPHILKRNHPLEEKSGEVHSIKPRHQSEDIESQLSEIQRRLADLSGY